MYFNNCGNSSINKTFILEPQSVTGDTPTLSACTTMYTNLLESCSGDTTIQLGTGLVTFNSNVDGVNSFSANTIEASTYYSGGTNLLDVFSGFATDYYVTGGTFSDIGDSLTLVRNDGANVIITGITNFFTTGGTYDNNTNLIYFDRNDQLSAFTVDLSTIDVNDTFSTGGTYDASTDTITITRNDGGSFGITGITDTFTTGATLIGDTVYFDTNESLSAYTADLSALEVNDTFISGVTLSGSILTLERNDGVDLGVNLDDIVFSGGSGNCITDLYVTNIYGCSPVTVHDELNVSGYSQFATGVTVTNGDVKVLNGKLSVNNPNSNFTLSVEADNNEDIATFRDVDGEDVFMFEGSIGTNDLDFRIGDASTGFGAPIFRQFQTSGSTQFGYTDVYIGNTSLNSYTATTKLYVEGTTKILSGFTADSVNIVTTPTLNNSATEILSRNSSTGEVEYRDVSSIIGAASADTYTTGGTYNDTTDTITFTNNIGGTYTVTGITDTFVSGVTFNNGNYQLTTSRNDATNFVTDLSILASDIKVTGGTYDINTGIVIFTNNSGGTFEVSGFTSGMTDSYTTTATTSGTKIQFDNNLNGPNFYNVDLTPIISAKTDVTLFNSHTADTSNPHQTTFSALTSTAHTHTISDVSGLQTELDAKALQTDLVTHTGDTNNPHNVTIAQVSGVSETLFETYTGDTAAALSGKVETSLFNTYTGDTATALLTKVEGANNVGSGAGEVFRDKTGTTLNFRTLSGGTNTTVTTVGDVNVIDVTIPADTNTYTTGTTVVGPTLYFDRNDALSAYTADLSSFLDNTNYYATGGTYNAGTESIDFSGNNVDANFSVNVSALIDDTNTYITGFTYDDANTLTIVRNDLASFSVTINTMTGLTVNGSLSAVTVSADTYYGDGSNLTGISTQDTFATGGTFTNNELIITNNTGGTFSTVIDTFTSATIENYIDFEANGDPTAVSGRTYYDASENALSYYPQTPAMDVTINIGQESVIQVYNNTGSLIPNGSACEVHGDGTTGGIPSVRLAIASATTVLNDTRYQVTGIATHDIPNGQNGFITKHGIVRDLTITGVSEGTDVWLSDTVAGGYVYDITSYPATSRISKIGHIVTTGVTTAKILVDISNEPTSKTSILEDTLLTQNNASTGVVSGATVSTASTTTFNVASGKGHVANNANPLVPIFTIVDWDAFTGVTSTYVGDTGETHTYLTVTSSGTLVQTAGSVGLTAQQKRQEILIGGLLHIGGQIIFTWERQIPLTNPLNQLEDLTTSIGPFSISGNRIFKIPNELSLEKSLGESFYLGGNYHLNTENPNILTNGTLSASTLVYANGTTIIGPNGTGIDVDNYDPDGLGTVTSIGANNFVAHRVWFQPTENVLVFQYGQQQWPNLADARVNFALEDYVSPKVLLEETYLVAVIICREGETDLDNTARAQIIPQGKFAGTGGGGTTPDTLQSAYNNSVSPEIVTDVSRGPVDFKQGSGAPTNVVTFQNTSGVVTGYVTGSGALSANTVDANNLFVGGSNINTIYNTISQFDLHTGNTSNPHQVTFSALTSTAHTHTISDVIGLQTALDTKLEDLNNLGSGEGLYTGKTNQDGWLKSIASSGGSVTVTSDATTINIEVPADNNTFVTGGTSDTGGTITLTRNDDVSVVIDNKEVKRYVVTDGFDITSGVAYLGNSGAKFLSFDGSGASDEQGSFNFAVPSDYVSGGTFYIKFTTLATANDVQFEMNITSRNNGEDISTPTDTAIQNATTGAGTSWDMVETAAYSPSSSTFSPNKNVMIRLNRDASDAPDTYTGVAYVWGIVFEYTGIK